MQYGAVDTLGSAPGGKLAVVEVSNNPLISSSQIKATNGNNALFIPLFAVFPFCPLSPVLDKEDSSPELPLGTWKQRKRSDLGRGGGGTTGTDIRKTQEALASEPEKLSPGSSETEATYTHHRSVTGSVPPWVGSLFLPPLGGSLVIRPPFSWPQGASLAVFF